MPIFSRAIGAGLVAWASRLRFPKLLALTAALFLLDLLIPDALPFVDEILLGLVTALLAGLRRRSPRRDAAQDLAR